MPDPWAYEPVLSSKATAFVVGLAKIRQRRLLLLLEKLASNPHQLGDYSEPDQSGRAIQFILIGEFVIGFWADHPVKEFRIVDIEEV
jgi:hypothetical protein